MQLRGLLLLLVLRLQLGQQQLLLLVVHLLLRWLRCLRLDVPCCSCGLQPRTASGLNSAGVDPRPRRDTAAKTAPGKNSLRAAHSAARPPARLSCNHAATSAGGICRLAAPGAAGCRPSRRPPANTAGSRRCPAVPVEVRFSCVTRSQAGGTRLGPCRRRKTGPETREIIRCQPLAAPAARASSTCCAWTPLVSSSRAACSYRTAQCAGLQPLGHDTL